MKNSTEYAKKVKKLYLSLRRKSPKVQKLVYEDPVEALVYGIISENMTNSKTRGVMKRIGDNFVDLNDLRVSLPAEVIEILGENSSVTRNIVESLSKALGYVFSNYNCVSLESLKKQGKRPAKQSLEKIEGVSRFVVNYCMLTALGGHAVPLTGKIVEYLKNNELVAPGANEQDIEGFLTRQVSATNGYEFYTLLRQESESRRAKKKVKKVKEKKKAVAKKKTKAAKSARKKPAKKKAKKVVKRKKK